MPGTLDGTGLLVESKDFPALAELVHRVAGDPELREAVVAGQRERLRAFDREVIGAQLRAHLAALSPAGGEGQGEGVLPSGARDPHPYPLPLRERGPWAR